MPNSTQRITIRDVAARVGVSHQTVSRVINNDQRVSPETRQKVEAVITELGYRPSALAQDMALGYPHAFACLSPNLTDYTFSSIIEGATAEVLRHGYYLISASAPDDKTFSSLVDQLISTRRTAGLIVLNPYADGRHSCIPINIPATFVGARPREEAINSVALDDEAAGHSATQHLIGLGHRRIAHLTGPVEEDCSQDRKTGYQLAMHTARLHVDPELVVEGDWSATSGYTAVNRWIKNRIHFTALFAQNDRMAVGAMHALHEAGKRVPEDVSVIGFDDMPLASYFDPPLTTMHQDMYGIGREAGKLIVRAVNGSHLQPRHLKLPAELVVRQSTAHI
jgi:DNA-binding LacI/PurR family transcriptional regulator